jgi:hypothetical protein
LLIRNPRNKPSATAINFLAIGIPPVPLITI